MNQKQIETPCMYLWFDSCCLIFGVCLQKVICMRWGPLYDQPKVQTLTHPKCFLCVHNLLSSQFPHFFFSILFQGPPGNFPFREPLWNSGRAMCVKKKKKTHKKFSNIFIICASPFFRFHIFVLKPHFPIHLTNLVALIINNISISAPYNMR